MHLNLNQPAFFQNPYPFYETIRETGTPFWIPADRDLNSKGTWLFWRYSDALEIFRQAGGISKNILAIRDAASSSAFDVNMLNMDGEAHLRLRRLVEHYFTAGAVRRLETHIEAVADELVRDLLHQPSQADLVSDFAEQLPLRVIARLVGIPIEDMAKVRAWSLGVSPAFDSIQSSNEAVAAARQTCFREFTSYLEMLISVRADTPDDSLLSHLIDAHKQGAITLKELSGMLSFLLFAGHETTINLISSGLWLLLSHPEQWQLLRSRGDLLPGAVEEILRFESPAQRSTFRIATEPVEIGGFLVEPGQQISVIIGAANRDEAEFRNPGVFDIQRNPNRHLAFGMGVHSCLGKGLARAEARIALGKIIEHLPSLRLVEPTPLWRKNSFFRGLASLPVSLA